MGKREQIPFDPVAVEAEIVEAVRVAKEWLANNNHFFPVNTQIKSSLDYGDEVLDLCRNDPSYKQSLDKDRFKVMYAKKVAKKHNIDFREILKKMTPSGNVVGFISWDLNGNPCKVV